MNDRLATVHKLVLRAILDPSCAESAMSSVAAKMKAAALDPHTLFPPTGPASVKKSEEFLSIARERIRSKQLQDDVQRFRSESARSAHEVETLRDALRTLRNKSDGATAQLEAEVEDLRLRLKDGADRRLHEELQRLRAAAAGHNQALAEAKADMIAAQQEVSAAIATLKKAQASIQVHKRAAVAHQDDVRRLREDIARHVAELSQLRAAARQIGRAHV